MGANVAPTIVGVQFLTNVPTGAGGTAISVQFSKSIDTLAGAAVPVVLPTVSASVKVNGAAQVGAITASADLTTFSWKAPTGGTGAGGTINTPDVMTVIGGTTGTPAVPAGIADELEAPLNANASFNASANTVKPAMAAAITSIAATTQGVWGPQAQAGGDTLTITAKPGGGADGANATLFAMAEVAPVSTALVITPTTAAGVTTFTFSWPAGVYTNAAALAAAFNGSAPFNTLFVANVSGAAAAGASAGAGTPAYNAGSGTFTYSVAVVWNKPVIPGGAQDTAAPGAYTFTGPAVVPAVVYGGIPTTLGVPVAQAQTPVNVLLYIAGTAASELVKGSTTLTVTAPGAPGSATAVTDFAGNTMTNPSTITLS
jgi:hypothetical protein